MILVLIQILITVVIGAILFWLIDRFIRDRRLANLLKILWCWFVWRQFCSDFCRWPGSVSRAALSRALNARKNVIR
jgi:hypothetical protein